MGLCVRTSHFSLLGSKSSTVTLYVFIHVHWLTDIHQHIRCARVFMNMQLWHFRWRSLCAIVVYENKSSKLLRAGIVSVFVGRV
jgi:hypothetical protein